MARITSKTVVYVEARGVSKHDDWREPKKVAKHDPHAAARQVLKEDPTCDALRFSTREEIKFRGKTYKTDRVQEPHIYRFGTVIDRETLAKFPGRPKHEIDQLLHVQETGWHIFTRGDSLFATPPGNVVLDEGVIAAVGKARVGQKKKKSG